MASKQTGSFCMTCRLHTPPVRAQTDAWYVGVCDSLGLSFVSAYYFQQITVHFYDFEAAVLTGEM